MSDAGCAMLRPGPGVPVSDHWSPGKPPRSAALIDVAGKGAGRSYTVTLWQVDSVEPARLELKQDEWNPTAEETDYLIMLKEVKPTNEVRIGFKES